MTATRDAPGDRETRPKPPLRPYAGVTLCMALLSVVFGSFSLVIVTFQKFFLQLAPASTLGPSLDILHGLWLTWMPLLVLGGAFGLVAGRALYTDHKAGRLLTRLAAWIALGWLFGYTCHTQVILSGFIEATFGDVPASAGLPSLDALAGFGRASGIGFSCLFAIVPAVLLVRLRRPVPPR